MTAARPSRRALVVVAEPGDSHACELCGNRGGLARQQVGDDPDAVFVLCASCGTPAVDDGTARWLPAIGA